MAAKEEKIPATIGTFVTWHDYMKMKSAFIKENNDLRKKLRIAQNANDNLDRINSNLVQRMTVLENAIADERRHKRPPLTEYHPDNVISHAVSKRDYELLQAVKALKGKL